MTFLVRSSRVVVRIAAFGGLWFVLTEGDTYAWWLGALVVAVATAASIVLWPRFGLRPVGLARFLPFFLKQSLLGGVDVARRALDPRLPLDPGFVDCPLRLPPGVARVALADTMSLVPGTVSVELRDHALRLHVIDQSLPAAQTLRRLEALLADVFGFEIPSSQGNDPGRPTPTAAPSRSDA